MNGKKEVLMRKGRPTMKDVAALAGVTQPTVSYVINGTATISEEVKEKVNRAIKELNYEPNYTARALKTNRSEIIGILIPDISNEYYSRMVSLISTMLRKRGYTTMVSSTNYEKDTEMDSLRKMLTYNVDGMIVAYQLLNEECWKVLKDAGCNGVVLEGGSAAKGLSCMNTDNFYGAYEAVKFLQKQGRKYIAYVGQHTELEAIRDRFQGYQKAMEEEGMYDPKLVCDTEGPSDKWQEGIHLGKKLLRFGADGILVSSDIVAAGILKTFLNAGKKVPEEVAVIGYDDVPLAEVFVPALSTVAQPIQEMCQFAVERVLDKRPERKTEVLKPKLILRETT